MSDPQTGTAVRYRRMTEQDLDAAHRLSLSVRWPHRLEDWAFIQRLGAGYVAENDEGLIGTALCWSHGTEFASIGMVIVAGAWQGKGIGRKLMAMVMAELGSRNVLLHATAAGRDLYARIGFQQIGEIHQHQGTVFKSPLMPLQPGSASVHSARAMPPSWRRWAPAPRACRAPRSWPRCRTWPRAW